MHLEQKKEDFSAGVGVLSLYSQKGMTDGFGGAAGRNVSGGGTSAGDREYGSHL